MVIFLKASAELSITIQLLSKLIFLTKILLYRISVDISVLLTTTATNNLNGRWLFFL